MIAAFFQIGNGDRGPRYKKLIDGVAACRDAHRLEAGSFARFDIQRRVPYDKNVGRLHRSTIFAGGLFRGFPDKFGSVF